MLDDKMELDALLPLFAFDGMVLVAAIVGMYASQTHPRTISSTCAGLARRRQLGVQAAYW